MSSKIQKYNGHSYDINEAKIRAWRVYILIISVHNYKWCSCLKCYYLPRLETINGFDSRGRRDVTRRHIWRHLTSEFSAVSRYFRNGSSQKRKPMKIGEERPPKKGEGHSPGTLCKAWRILAATLKFPHHVGAGGEESASWSELDLFSLCLFLRSILVTVMIKLIPIVFYKTSELIELCLRHIRKTSEL